MKRRVPITKKKDGRDIRYKAGKEVGYYEAVMEHYRRTLDWSALGYLNNEREVVIELIKKYKDTAYNGLNPR